MADFFERHMRDVERLRGQWLDLGRRCVAQRDSVVRAQGALPRRARGYKAACIDAVCRVSDHASFLVVVMSDWDHDLAGLRPQPPGEKGFLAAVGFYDEIQRTLGSRDESRGAIVPRARWVEIGREWKQVRDEAAGVRHALGGFVRKSSRVLAVAKRLEKSILRARCQLDAVVHAQHPDWEDATKVFYGPNRPIPIRTS